MHTAEIHYLFVLVGVIFLFPPAISALFPLCEGRIHSNDPAL
jgi:hypothetical protein